jgi:flagella basal body P-ring formation protein FlgA
MAMQVVMASAVEVTLELRPDVVLTGPQATLSDLAEVGTTDAVLQKHLSAIVVGRAPLVGHVEQRSRAELDLLLRSQVMRADQSIVWRGAPLVKIRRASQALPVDRLVGVARGFVQRRFDADRDGIDIRLDGALAEVAAPLGEVELSARMAGTTRLRARMAVWVDVVVQGGLYRSVVVPLLVNERRQVYVARRALAVGGNVTADDFELREEDVAGLADAALAPGGLAAPARMREALDAGQVATVRQVALAGTVLRGDEVRLRTGAAGIAVETNAYAQANGTVGQRIPVKPMNSNETIMAWVTAPGVVSMERR